MPLHPIYAPVAIGRAALAELPRVPWAKLAFASNPGDGTGLEYDVAATLRGLGEDTWEVAMHAAHSNIIHEGTVYEATAYAFPFIAALAADPHLAPKLRWSLICLASAIALSGPFEVQDGGTEGAYGDGVSELICSAILGARANLEAIAAFDDAAAELVPAMLMFASNQTKAAFETLYDLDDQAQTRLGEMLDDDEEALAPTIATSTARYRHPKLGDATLVRAQENGLLLRFDDGKDRVIQARFVTLIES